MNPLEIIQKYYPKDSQTYDILVTHSRLVADKCLSIAKNKPSLVVDILFVEEAAMLHDIGIFLTNAPGIACFGEQPYICHGHLGAELLRKEGFPKHALVAERHTGTGITLDEIEKKDFPLPKKDMIPVSMEEQLICFADKFYSKTKPDREKTMEEVRISLGKISEESVVKFDAWCELFL